MFERAGTYYLAETLVLDRADSGLTIAAYNNEAVEVSGGVPLTGLKWTPTNASSPIYTATVDPALLPHGIKALQLDGRRATLARYPNANPELDLFPTGYVTLKTEWLPPKYKGEVCNPHHQCGTSVNYTIKTPREEWHGMYQDYTVGIGGSCDVYDPPYSPWCSGQFYLERQFPEMHTRHPSGFRPNTKGQADRQS